MQTLAGVPVCCDKGRKTDRLETDRYPVFIRLEFSMNKIVSGFLALCMVAALGVGVAQAKDKDHDMMGGHHMGRTHKCPAGQHWVHGYKNKYGKHVKGYCR